MDRRIKDFLNELNRRIRPARRRRGGGLILVVNRLDRQERAISTAGNVTLFIGVLSIGELAAYRNSHMFLPTVKYIELHAEEFGGKILRISGGLGQELSLEMGPMSFWGPKFFENADPLFFSDLKKMQIFVGEGAVSKWFRKYNKDEDLTNSAIFYLAAKRLCPSLKIGRDVEQFLKDEIRKATESLRGIIFPGVGKLFGAKEMKMIGLILNAGGARIPVFDYGELYQQILWPQR